MEVLSRSGLGAARADMPASGAGPQASAVPSLRQAPAAATVDAAAGATRTLLRLEGLAVLALAVAAYANWGAGWMVFAGFFLVPDLSMLGYAWGPRAGAVVYNAGHSYAGPIVLLGVGTVAALPLATAFALIWIAHIGFDRALGYGLKSVRGFRYTHLGTLGRPDAW